MKEFHVLEIGNGYGFYCDLEYEPPIQYQPPILSSVLKKVDKYIPKNQSLGMYILQMVSSGLVAYLTKIINKCFQPSNNRPDVFIWHNFYNVKKII